MQPGKETSYKLIIPYRHPQTTLNPKSGDSLGTLALVVYSQLNTVTGGNPVTVSMHGRLLAAHVATPLPCNRSTTEWFNNNRQLHAINSLEARSSRFTPQSDIASSKATLGGSEKDIKPVILPPIPRNDPVPAATSDAAVKLTKAPMDKVKTPRKREKNNALHFEDSTTDLQALCKRSGASCTGSVTLSSSTSYDTETIDIANQILFPNGTGKARADNGSGFIGWFAPMFRGFRGDIRLKIDLQVVPTAANTSYVPIVEGYLTTSQESWGLQGVGTDTLALDASSLLMFQTQPNKYTPRSPNQHWFKMTAAIPEVLEIEIPYSRLSGFSIPAAYSGNMTGDPYGLGVLNFVFACNAPIAVTITYRIYASFGDAARFGIPFMIPRVHTLSGMYPDSWTRSEPPPPLESQDSESDIEIIQPNTTPTVVQQVPKDLESRRVSTIRPSRR